MVMDGAGSSDEISDMAPSLGWELMGRESVIRQWAATCLERNVAAIEVW